MKKLTSILSVGFSLAVLLSLNSTAWSLTQQEAAEQCKAEGLTGKALKDCEINKLKDQNPNAKAVEGAVKEEGKTQAAPAAAGKPSANKEEAPAPLGARPEAPKAQDAAAE